MKTSKLKGLEVFILLSIFGTIVPRGERMKSIWNNIDKPKFDSLQGDIKTDVLIIGGGMC